jgi:hypothetical protein
MPDGSSVELVGLDDAFADFRKWADQLGPAIGDQARAFAGRVASRVHPPVLTGALASSVDVETIAEDGIGLSIGDGLDYAGWIEFGGSRGRPAIPQGRYLYPAAEASEAEWLDLAEQVAETTIGRFPWSTAV